MRKWGASAVFAMQELNAVAEFCERAVSA